MNIKHGAAEHYGKVSPGYSDQLHLGSSKNHCYHPYAEDAPAAHLNAVPALFLSHHPTPALYYCVCLLYNCSSPREAHGENREWGVLLCILTACWHRGGTRSLLEGHTMNTQHHQPTTQQKYKYNPHLEAAFICSSICILCKWSKPHLEGFLCSSNTKQLTFVFIITIIIIYYLIIIYCLWGLAIVLQIS